MKSNLYIVLALSLSLNLLSQTEKNTTTPEFTFVEKMPIFSKECANLNDESKIYNCSQKAIKDFIDQFNPYEYVFGCVEGKIFVGFIIDIDGSIIDVKLLRGFNEVLDNAAVEHIKKMPNFYKPGYQRGLPVKVRYTIPIKVK